MVDSVAISDVPNRTERGLVGNNTLNMELRSSVNKSTNKLK